ncbi:MAG: biotin--[acetyl-CoA-carboxylase] ligase [Desulfobulbaceae bacterium]|nr:biotin--[acetyl-CoA-carboxylase] ligase [Desulfobulbaceae bacterium]
MMEASGKEFEIIRYPLVDSTNRLALVIGSQNVAHGTVIVADRQSGGQGRNARSFSSPHGGLYLSAILRPQLPIDDLPLVTLAAGVACAEAVETFTGVRVLLKWPNDMYHQGRKVGGILTEAAPYQLSDGVPFVVVGIGLNVNTSFESFSKPLQDIATSLYCITGQQYVMDDLLISLIRRLLVEVALLCESPGKVLEHWQERDLLRGRNLCWVEHDGRRVFGVGGGLLDDGRYRLTTSDGEIYSVLAGDIEITDIDGQSIK